MDILVAATKEVVEKVRAVGRRVSDRVPVVIRSRDDEGRMMRAEQFIIISEMDGVPLCFVLVWLMIDSLVVR